MKLRDEEMSIKIKEDYLDNEEQHSHSTNNINETNIVTSSRTALPTTLVNLQKTYQQQSQREIQPVSSRSNDLDTLNTTNISVITAPGNIVKTNLFNNRDFRKPSFANLQDELSSMHTVNSTFKRSFVSSEIPDIFNSYGSSDEGKRLTLHDIDKNFFILTSAGKLIYSYLGNEDELLPLMGIVNTIIEFFKINEDREIKSIKTDGSILVFSNRSPIILAGYSKRGDSISELTDQLDFLYSYLLSSLTKKQIVRLFNKRENFDLRNYLEPSDFTNLKEVCNMMVEKLYPDISLGALESLPFKSSATRNKLHDLMSKHLLKESDLPRGTLLYGLMVYPNNRLISVLRPKSHTLHTTDLQLLFYSIFNRFKTTGVDNKLDVADNTNKELWVPICFPKFNPNGFLYCYIKFLTNHDEKLTNNAFGLNNETIFDDHIPALVLLSAEKDAFYGIKNIANKFINDLIAKKLLKQIKYSNSFSISEIPAPFVHHFIYKSNFDVQYIQPTSNYNNYLKNLVNPLKSLNQYHLKLRTYYQQLYTNVINGNSGMPINKSMVNFINWEQQDDLDFSESEGNSTENLNIKYKMFKEEKTNVMGMAWITPKFELYLICNNGVNDKDVVFMSAKKIAKWCNNNKSRLFVTDGVMY